MSTILWTVSLVLFVLPGLLIWKFDDIARLDLPARISVAFGCGLVAVSLLMYGLSATGIRWSAMTVAGPLLILAVSGVAVSRRSHSATSVPWPAAPAAGFSGIVLLALYGAADARMTNADLLYFWGPKSAHFALERGIDVELLRFPHYYLMHPDYPPLVPLTWAASSLLAGTFSYWGAVYTTVVGLCAAALVFRGLSAPVIGARSSSAFAALLLAILTFATTAGSAAGGADAYLILFETIALSALTFSRHRGAAVLAAIALAGAAFTKVEGAAFVATVAVAMILVGRFRVALLTAAPAVLLVASWIWFAGHHGLLDSYGRAERNLHLGSLGVVVATAARQLSYGAYYLPWIAALAPLAGARQFRRAALPLLVGAGSIAYTLYFYLHEADPQWWIRASAERVMLTALMCFSVASAAAAGDADEEGAGIRS